MISGIKIARTQPCTISSQIGFKVFRRSLTVIKTIHRINNSNVLNNVSSSTKTIHMNALSIHPGLMMQKRWAQKIIAGSVSKLQNKIPKELLEGLDGLKITAESPPPKKTYFGAIDILEDLHKRLGEPSALSEFHTIRDNPNLSLAEQWSAVAHKILNHTVYSISNNGFYPKKENIVEWRSQKYHLLTTTTPSIPGTIKSFTPEEALMQQDIMKDLNRSCWVIPFEHGFRSDWQESALQTITLLRLHTILEDLVQDFQSMDFKNCIYAIKMDLVRQQMKGMKAEIIQRTLNDKIIPLYDRVLAKHQLPGEQGWINFQIAMFDYDPDPKVRSQSEKLNNLLHSHDPTQRQMPPK